MRLPDVAPLSPWPSSPQTVAWDKAPGSSLGVPTPSNTIDGDIPTPSSTHRGVALIKSVGRAILPSPNYLARYPLHVVYTKAAFSENISRAKEDYLLVSTRPAPAAEDASEPPGRRWLKESPRHFYRAKDTKTQDEEGKDVWQVDPVSHLPLRLGYLDITSHIWKRYGWRGFFRGIATAHCTDLIHVHLAAKLYQGFDAGYLKLFGRLDSQEIETLPSFRKRFVSWFKTDEGRVVVTKSLASTISSTVTFPLSTIMLRQILYEPYDDQPLGFLDMAKLTVIYDGPETLLAGVVPYSLIKFTVGAMGAVARAAVSAAGWDDGDDKLGSFVSEQSKAIIESICHPVIQYIQHKHAKSLIPGLVSGESKTIAQCYRNGSPGLFIMLASNAVLLGMRIVASTHFHFLMSPEID